jgi:hypothetical protein
MTIDGAVRIVAFAPSIVIAEVQALSHRRINRRVVVVALGSGVSRCLPTLLGTDLTALGGPLTQHFVPGPFPLLHHLIPLLNTPRAFEAHTEDSALIHGDQGRQFNQTPILNQPPRSCLALILTNSGFLTLNLRFEFRLLLL